MSIEVHVRVRPGVANSAWTTADTVICSTSRQDHRFPFGRVYNTSASNNTIFSAVDPLIHAAFDGKNVTIMAYGQTGSGKTHSMVGASTDAGVMRRTAEVLSNLRASYPGSTVDASCIEIYNETVSDLLLDPKERKPIDIRGDGVNTTYFKTLVPITCLQDFITLHANAERYRRYGVTDLNGHSSRSHIILAFHIRKANRSEGSVINLVDLAGSESAGKAGTTGETLREGGFINRSLLALGNVVSDIVAKKSHIAFRGSNLTRLLSPCLSGDGYTFILCCINPGVENYDQTVNALQFSQRAMRIKKDPTVTLTNMPPLFTFHLHKQLVARQARVAEMIGSAYQSGLYETYTTLRGAVLGAITDKQNKAIADAQQEAYALQAQLIAKDHLSSVNHLKRQREALEAHRQRKLAAIAALEEKDRGERDMARRVEEMRSKKTRAEADYKALFEDSEEAKAQWNAALEEAHAVDFERAVDALLSEESVGRLEIEAQRPLFLEQIAEKMMATVFERREEVIRALSAIPTPANIPATAHHEHEEVSGDEGGERSMTPTSSRAQTMAAKLAVYKQQLRHQWAELNAAAKAVREMEGDLALDINPSLFGMSEEEAASRIRELETEVGDLQYQLSQIPTSMQPSRSSTPPPLPTARHNVPLMSSSSSTAAAKSPSLNMARLKSAVSAINDAKSRMKGGHHGNAEMLIFSPPDDISAVLKRKIPPPPNSVPHTYTYQHTASSSAFGNSLSPNTITGSSSGANRPTHSSMAKLSAKMGSTRHEDPMNSMMGDGGRSGGADVMGIAARRKAEGVIRGRNRI